MRLRWSILALVGIALVPLVLVAALVVWRAHRDERKNLEQGLLERARALAVGVDREVDISIAALEGLATADALDTGQLKPFYEQARRAKELHPWWLSVVLIDPSGRQLMNLLRPLETPLPSLAETEVFQRTLRTRAPEVSDLFMGPTAHRWLIAVNVPVLRDERLRYVLSATMAPDGFVSLLAAAQIPADSLATIIDRQGIMVARTKDAEQRVGTPAEAAFVALTRQQDEAVFPGPTLDGWNAYRAFSRARRSQLAVAIAVPAELVDAPLRRSLWALAGTAVVAFGVSMGLAVLAGRRVSRRMGALAAALNAFGRGETGRELPTFWIAEFRGIAHALSDAMSLLRARTEALQKSEAALVASEARYRRLIDESAEGIIIHQAGVMRFVNGSAARLFGYDRPAEAVGQPVLQHIAPEQRDTVQARIDARIRGDAVPLTNEFEVLRRDGTRFWVEATAAVMEWEGPLATRVSLLDIGERRRRETAEREAENLRSVTMLANATAHEINNPLTVVAGSLHFLADQSPEDTSASRTGPASRPAHYRDDSPHAIHYAAGGAPRAGDRGTADPGSPTVEWLGAGGGPIDREQGTGTSRPRIGGGVSPMETILVVDDEPDVRAVARDVLEAKGYRLLEAGNAEEALQVAQEHGEPIDLLLTDIVMPGLHGHELAARLRAQRPALKVLYMSGFALAQAQHEMMETRAGLEPGSPLLPKPFSPESLTKKVGEVLATRSPSPSPFARAPRTPPRPDPWWP